MTNVDRKIASSGTISISIGHCLDSMKASRQRTGRYVYVDERPRPGETGDPIIDPQLHTGGPWRLFRRDDGVALARAGCAHGGPFGSCCGLGACNERLPSRVGGLAGAQSALPRPGPAGVSARDPTDANGPAP